MAISKKLVGLGQCGIAGSVNNFNEATADSSFRRSKSELFFDLDDLFFDLDSS